MVLTSNKEELRNLIKVDINLPHSIYTGQRTYSSLFLIPAFQIDINSNIYDYFVNAYTDDYGISHLYKRPLFVLMESSNSPRYNAVHKELKTNKFFVYDYVVGANKGKMLHMYVFECPDEYSYDYDKFLRGQYSKFSVKYKSKFQKVFQNEKGEYVESPLYGAIHKTQTFKKKIESMLFNKDDNSKNLFLDPEQEYFGKPESKIEIFRYQKFNQ